MHSINDIGLRCAIDRKSLRKLLATVEPGRCRDITSKHRFFAVVLSGDNGEIRLRATATSREIGLGPISGTIERSGLAWLPVLIFRRILDKTRDAIVTIRASDDLTQTVISGRGWQFTLDATGYARHDHVSDVIADEPSPAIMSPRRGRWDHIAWADLAARYRSGEGLTAISRDTGIPPETIHGRLRSLGVQFGGRKKAECA